MNLYAVCSPGIEPFLSQELQHLGIQHTVPYASSSTSEKSGEDIGGIEFNGNMATLYSANLHLRTASRILVRLGDFSATSFPELKRKTATLPWHEYISPEHQLNIRVTCHKSRLYHSDAVAQRINSAILDVLGRSALTTLSDSKVKSEKQLIIVRIINDHCYISLDSSGELLHRRGYRLATAKAPLRESLAAALLIASGWDGSSPLLDPFCGSGTIPIEAAMMLLKVPPGLRRNFTFQRWENFDSKVWTSMLAQVQTATTAPTMIHASDRDAGAIKLASENAERANVFEQICFEHKAVSSITPPSFPGWIVTNPPYGVRVSSSHDLRNLYAQIGKVLRNSCPGWQFAVLCNQDFLIGHTGLKMTRSHSFINGGISVKLYCGTVPS